MQMKRPDYEALDEKGFPIVREARYINELPTPETRGQALVDAMPAISKLLDLEPISKISYGLPVHASFQLKRTEQPPAHGATDDKRGRRQSRFHSTISACKRLTHPAGAPMWPGRRPKSALHVLLFFTLSSGTFAHRASFNFRTE
jgi:hypothetical protein